MSNNILEVDKSLNEIRHRTILKDLDPYQKSSWNQLNVLCRDLNKRPVFMNPSPNSY